MKSSSSATFFGFVYLLLVTLLTGGLAWRCAPERLSWTHDPSAMLTAQVEAAGFPVLDIDELLAWMSDANPPMLLDSRAMEFYDAGQIPGALSLPLRDFEEIFPDLVTILEPDSPLVVYCSGAECDEALLLAERLREAGQRNVSVFPGGWESWVREVGP